LGGRFLGAAQTELITGQVSKQKEEGPVMSDLKSQNNKSENRKSENPDPAISKPGSREPEGNRTPAMAGLAIAVVLLVVGLWLARELTAASKMQDCLMSGRTNCNAIQPQ
jgi:hypothetical protein